MIIACPRCGTSYEVRADLFGGEGRSVECSSCAHRWIQTADGQTAPKRELASVKASRAELSSQAEQAPRRDESPRSPPRIDSPAPLPAQPPQETVRRRDEPPPAPKKEIAEAAEPEAVQPAAQTTTTLAATDASGPFEAAPAAVEVSDQAALDKPEAGADTKRRVGARKTKPERSFRDRAREIIRKPLFTAGVAAVATFITLAAVLIMLRGPIISVLPSAAGVYGVFGLAPDPLGAGLEIREIEGARELLGSEDVLRVTGVVANVAGSTQPLPSIRVSLFDDNDKEVQFTTLVQKHEHLEPGEALSFDATITEPRPEARRIRVGFVAAEP